jgi:protein-tyrosine-phosphatase
MGAESASLLTTYAEPGTSSRGVPDPFGGDLPTYRETYREIEQLVALTFRRLALARSRSAP